MENEYSAEQGGSNSRPRLSKEEYIEKKKEELANAYQMADDATAEIMSDPEKFKEYLNIQSRLSSYSVTNALLIYAQRPNATLLKTFQDWENENAKILKGAKGIFVLEPKEYTKKDGNAGVSFRTKKVFDVSQTTAPQTPAPTVNHDPQRLVMIMLNTAPVKSKNADEMPMPNMGAFWDNDQQILFVKRNIGDSVALCQCVAQELAHAQISLDSTIYSRRDAGFQAVCVGYMICARFGVDTKNFPIDHIPQALADKEPKEVRAELNKIRSTANKIASRILGPVRTKERERGMER